MSNIQQLQNLQDWLLCPQSEQNTSAGILGALTGHQIGINCSSTDTAMSVEFTGYSLYSETDILKLNRPKTELEQKPMVRVLTIILVLLVLCSKKLLCH